MSRVLGYLADYVAAVQSQFDIQVPTPWLFALSGSGPTAFGIAAANPKGLRGLVAIVASAGNTEGLSYPVDFPILLISGTQDPSFPADYAREEYQDLIQQGAKVKMVEIDDDHYLFLSSPQEFSRIIEEFRSQAVENTANG